MENLFSDLCTRCGMCCDGTLFEKASLKDQADKKLVQNFGLETFTETDGKHYFRQPCHRFSDCCTIYQQRPHVCTTFFCTPLREVQQGKTEWTVAKDKVERTLQFRAEILTMAAQIEIYKAYNIRQLIDELHPQPSEQIKQHAALWLKLIGFQALRYQMTQKLKK